MRAAVLERPHSVVVRTLPKPVPGPSEVVVAVEAAGVCGTDVAVWLGAHPARIPVVMGHEFAGRVDSVGALVGDLEPGTAVMGQGGWPCGACPACRAGNLTSCSDRRLLGRTVDGCFAEFIVVPRSSVHVLPPGLSPLAAQSATGLATAIHAVERAGDLRGKSVAVVGPGHGGLLLLQVCRLGRPRDVCVFGTRSERLKLARRLGADRVQFVAGSRGQEADIGTGTSPTEMAGVVDQQGRFDVVFEASGTAAALEMAASLVGDGGLLVAYGIHDPGTTLPVEQLYSKELTIIGSRGAGGSYADAIQLLASHEVDALALVTHRVPLDDVNDALIIAHERRGGALRVVIEPRPELGARGL